MNKIAEFVEKNMTDDDRQYTIRQFDELERVGAIGECILRYKTEELLDYLGLDDDYNFIHWMRNLAFECNRFYAMLYIQEHYPTLY